jgi:hypothetical protein
MTRPTADALFGRVLFAKRRNSVRLLNPFRLALAVISLPAWLLVEILDWVSAKPFAKAAEVSRSEKSASSRWSASA